MLSVEQAAKLAEHSEKVAIHTVLIGLWIGAVSVGVYMGLYWWRKKTKPGVEQLAPFVFDMALLYSVWTTIYRMFHYEFV